MSLCTHLRTTYIGIQDMAKDVNRRWHFLLTKDPAEQKRKRKTISLFQNVELSADETEADLADRWILRSIITLVLGRRLSLKMRQLEQLEGQIDQNNPPLYKKITGTR